MKKSDHFSTTRGMKLVPMGRSLGVRLPLALLRKYGINDNVVLEALEDGILLRRGAGRTRLGRKLSGHKLSMAQTFDEMARAQAHGEECWSDLEAITGDGLARIPW